MKSPTLGTFYYLYLVTDIFSRRIVAARVYEAENDENAAELFLEVQAREGLKPGQVTLHSDNGGPMKGATLKATLERLGILTSFSRPRVSDDNPYAESLFGTMSTARSIRATPAHSAGHSQNHAPPGASAGDSRQAITHSEHPLSSIQVRQRRQSMPMIRAEARMTKKRTALRL